MRIFRYYIGIDTGNNTAIALWDSKEKIFKMIETVKIHEAILLLAKIEEKQNTMIIVEDARKRKWFGEKSELKLQGAGSVKRDAVIWQDFLTAHKFYFEMVAPRKGLTKMDAGYFKKITGWAERTNSHERDAAMLVFGR